MSPSNWRFASRSSPAALGLSYRSPPARSAAYDVVIENGRIVDGSGNAWFLGDIGIRGERIAAVVPRGGLSRSPAAQRVDARGLVVAPGFIDIQGQSGGAFLRGDGRDVGKLTQGVTTEILGEGTTPAPANAKTLEGAPLRDSAAIRAASLFQSPHGFDAWLTAMQQHGISPNVGSFVGAGTIRQYGMGTAMGAATPQRSIPCVAPCVARWRTARSASRRR